MREAGVDVRMAVLRKQGVKTQTGIHWLRIRASSWLFVKIGMNILISIKMWDILTNWRNSSF